MLDCTLRVEAATDERPGERERYRGIKGNDSVIRSARPNGAVCEHGVRCGNPTARPFALDATMFVDNALPGRLAFAILSLLVVASALNALIKSFHCMS